MSLRVDTESWVYKRPFRVSRGAEVELAVLVVTLTDADGNVGRGEAAGVDYHGETIALLCAQIDAVRPAIDRGIGAAKGRTTLDFAALATLLPSGGARNAVDCALWDLTAKQRKSSVWDLAGFPNPHRLTTSITLGIDTDEALQNGALNYSGWPLIKVKVDGERGKYLDMFVGFLDGTLAPGGLFSEEDTGNPTADPDDPFAL